LIPEGADELTWTVHGLQLRGLAWGPSDGRPLLALHGWLDNAASFALLAPHLTAHRVVALDLSGHGRSAWRSPDATYQIFDDLPQILAVVELLGWHQCDLLGHSRGAAISSLFAALFPQRVGRLVLLDGVAPPLDEKTDFVTQMQNFIRDKGRLQSRRSRVYKSVADAVASREEQGLTREAASLLVRRNLRACEGGYTWTTDPRLRGASAVKLTAEQLEAVLSAVSMPTLLLVADWGPAAPPEDRFRMAIEHIPDLTTEQVSGGHHFHMEEGVAKLSDRIQQFLEGKN